MLFIPAVLLASAAFLTGEFIARANHVADYPIYLADNRIGYIPAPNQSGSFRGQGSWAFNEYSMGTARPFKASDNESVLLIGDSIVFGRVTMTEGQRLAGRIAKLSGKDIWPISAGSWSLQNEVQYLENNPDVLHAVDRVVFVLNSNDFGRPSSWRSDEHRPTRRPTSALVHWMKPTKKKRLPAPPDEMLVTPKNPIAALKQVLSTTNIPVDIWLYPKLAELEDKSPLEKWNEILTAELAGRARIMRVSDIPNWSKREYGDRIHPNGRGDARLAKAISQSLER